MGERRLKWLARIVVVWGAVIFLKLISLQVIHHKDYVRLARLRQEQEKEIPAPRGAIFDRAGHVLALSTPTITVHVNPQKLPDIGVAAQILAAELHLNQVELYGQIKQAYDAKRGYLIVKKHADYEEAEHLRSLKLDWVSFKRESLRHYPNGSLAAHIIGGVDFEEKGNAGIEKAMETDLRGTPGSLRLLTDVKRRGISSQMESDAKPGTPVTLTIDARIQFVAERELAAAVEKHHATSGSLVAMNPATGDILAMASYPTYDPNLALKGDNPAKVNHAVGAPFEPGSVFKVITLSAALETTNLRPESLIDCHGGALKLPGRVVHDSHGGLGVIPMEMVLAKSSNVGAIMVGTRVGQANLYEYCRRFGFGQRTGITIPGESPGKLKKVQRWGTTTYASVSMGQEVSVTTVQLAQAASVVANGGLLVRPRLVLKKGEATVKPAPPVRALKPETAITMRQMMEGVVLHGTGTGARLKGYSVGGKTGTAQIFDVATHRYTHSYNASFMGFAPLTNPAIVLVVTLNGTRGNSGFGGAAALPVFKTVATEALRVMEVPKDVPDENPLPVQIATADTSDLADAFADAGTPNILEDGGEDDDAAPSVNAFVGPKPPPSPAPPKPVGPTAPNFVGKSLRAVLAEAAAKGLVVTADGSGIARVQFPAAGAQLRQGERIRVRFSR